MKFTAHILKYLSDLGVNYRPECIKMHRAYKNGPFYPNMNCKCKFYCNEVSHMLIRQRNRYFSGNWGLLKDLINITVIEKSKESKP